MKLAILFVLFSSFFVGSFSDVLQSLSDLYTSTDGPSWFNQWEYRADYCNGFYGITCENDVIVQIDLRGNGLRGTIPDSLMDITTLRIFRVDNNSFTGFPNLPPSIEQFTCSHCSLTGYLLGYDGRYPNLNNLDLNFNQFEGNIPDSWANLNLQSLSLEGNLMSGNLSIAMQSWPNIQSISLASNSFEGEIGDFFYSMKSLKYLYLGNNLFSGNFPKLPETVEDLFINNNLLTGSFPLQFGDLTNLWRVVAGNNMMTGELPPTLFDKMIALDTFELYNNIITGPLPDSICKCPSLSNLFLFSNEMTGEIPACMSELTEMNQFFISSNHFEGNLPNTTKWPIYLLYASQNMLSGVLPDFSVNLNLIFLDLSGNNLNGPVPNFPPYLISLDLSYNRLEGNIPENVGTLKNLITLDMSANKLQGKIPRNFANLTSLYALYMSFNNLNGTLPDLRNARALTLLRLNNNRLTGTLPTYFVNFPFADIQLKNNNFYGEIPTLPVTLLSFQIAHNNFSGSIDFVLGIRQVQSLDLSYNQFSGNIPTLTSLYILGRLLLNNNKFSGSIPVLSQVSNPLSYIDLSSNQLTGALVSDPLPLQAIYLNFSHNQLVGYIPQQYASFLTLEVLDLSNNQFYGSLPTALSRVTTLTKLILDNNGFIGEIPPTFSSLVNLQVLSISQNSFNAKNLTTLFQLNGLRTLNVSGNQLEGSIPETIGNLNSLEVFDISNNRIGGSLPSSFFSLRPFQQIKLSNNRLEGGLTNFGSDPKLLDLSGNLFSGNLTFLNSFTSISTLNISGNAFVGSVPDLSFKKQLVSVDLSSNKLEGGLQSFSGLTNLQTLIVSNNILNGSVPSFDGDSLLVDLDMSNNLFSDASLMTLIPSVANCILSNNSFECPLTSQASNQCGARCITSNLQSSSGRLRIEGGLKDFVEENFIDTFCKVMNITKSRMVILGTRSGSVIVDFQLSPPPSNSNEGSSSRILELMGSPQKIQQFKDNGVEVLDAFTSIPVDTSSQQQQIIYNNSELSKGAIAGIAVGGGIFVLIVIVVVVILIVRLKRAKDERYNQQFSNIDMSELNISAAAKSAIIDYDDIKGLVQIGSGAFGIVYKAQWREINVAVKQIRAEHVTTEQVKDFLSEVGILQGLRAHPNVVMFLGITIPPQPLALVIELCEGGSLFVYLRKEPISIEQKMKLMSGIALGMLHLHLEKVIHRDLAVRNILLTKFHEPKVADFGLSRQVESSDASVTNSSVGPLKWMAPEAIQNRQYSNKSDSWSFGVVIWEILTVTEPYADLTPVEAALQVVSNGLRLEIPKNTPLVLKDMMQQCWSLNPEQRPDFGQICATFSSMEKIEMDGEDLPRMDDYGERPVYSALTVTPFGGKASY